MGWDKNSHESGLGWYNQKQTFSESGCRTEYIYGFIKSPTKGHIVFFNNNEIFHRKVSGLDIVAGNQILLQIC